MDNELKQRIHKRYEKMPRVVSHGTLEQFVYDAVQEECKTMKEGFREIRTIYDTYEMNSEDMLFEIKKIAEGFIDEKEDT